MPSQLAPNVLSWASIIDDQTTDQATKLARLPFIRPHVALMPDAHLGKGATVGSVIPTDGAIIPAAVGVDIGCGMIAVRTQHRADDLPPDLTALRQEIESRIPLSPGRYNEALTDTAVNATTALGAAWEGRHGGQHAGPLEFAQNWALQLGSLGGGNHFIEVSLDTEDRVWFFLHSGSRGVGNKIAQHHMKLARRLAKKWFIDLPDPDLAYLPEGTPEFSAYLGDLHWAQSFAAENRTEMMRRVISAFTSWSGQPVTREQTVQCHHNYSARERHFGRDVWVSRKGAINAARGVLGLIPGSMGTASYVVEGLGNRASLNSAPHGAGRRHSRTAARRLFTQNDLRAAMQGIEYRDTDAFIDEHPAAYKDIDTVMADAADLVTVRATLHQIVNIKGE